MGGGGGGSLVSVSLSAVYTTKAFMHFHGCSSASVCLTCLSHNQP